MNSRSGHKPRRSQQGFSLIATVTMLVLLSLISVGLLTLSAATIRSSQAGSSRQEAEANARLGLMIAIGELQKTVGRDRFITAPAGIFDDSLETSRHYTGVWEAREDPRELGSADGLGKKIDYESQGAFRRWLVSNSDDKALEQEGFFDRSSLNNTIAMVADGTVGSDPDRQVKAGRVPIEKNGEKEGGSYAWWVSENGTKVSLGVRDWATAGDQTGNRPEIKVGDHLIRSGTPGVYGLDAIEELDWESNSETTNKVFTIGTTPLASQISKDVLEEYYHDLALGSRSLLTNVTSGGLKKDLSLFFEGEPEGGEWTGSIIEGNPPLGPYGKDSLSPHDEFDTGNWKQLRQHYSIHKTDRDSQEKKLMAGAASLQAVDDFSPTPGLSHPYPSWNHQRKLVTPVVQRICYILSVGVQDASRGRVSAEKLNTVTPRFKNFDKERNKYILTFHAFPAVVLWNPYNLKMECPGFSVGNMGMSVEHSVTASGGELDYQWIDHSYQSNDASWNVIGMTVDTPFELEPGEAKMFFGSEDVYRQTSQFYARGETARRVSNIDYDPSGRGGDFSAGIVKNGVIGDTYNQGDSNFPGELLLNGMYLNAEDMVGISTKVFTPQGSRNSGPRADYNGLVYYATYSSLDVRMIMRSFPGGYRTTPLWWTQWGGGGGNRPRASKWSGKVSWRNDEGNPASEQGELFSQFFVQDLVGGQKKPFMLVDLRMKSTDGDSDERNPNITWLHNIPYHPYSGISGQGTSGSETQGAGNLATAAHARPYTIVYTPVQSAFEAWNQLQLGTVDGELRPYMGNSYGPNGQHKAVATEVPLAPLQSIAQLQHVPQVPIDATRWSGLSLQNYAIGNSFANPNVPSDDISKTGWSVWLDSRVDNADSRTGMLADLDGKKWHETTNGQGPSTEHFKPTKHLDRSYVANTLLWDDFFFSGIADYNGSALTNAGMDTVSSSLENVMEDFFSQKSQLPNPRLVADLGEKEAEEVTRELQEQGGYRKVAAYIEMEGGFNVNSVSKTAWKAFLASNLKKGQAILLTGRTVRLNNSAEESSAQNYIISRYSAANGTGHEANSSSNERWLGYRVVTESDLDALAEEIVAEVKARGPFRSVAEFINRRLDSSDPELAVKGPLQAALDRSPVNSELASDSISKSEIRGTDYEFEEAALVSRHAGTPSYVMQGDLLQSLGPMIQVRSDTFTIRAYGESSDGEAQAWCEATVQREIDWVDSTDLPEEDYLEVSKINQEFGRKLRVVSFRWLSPSEV
ncbi:hypothetical protein QEH58_15110 [Roseibacillus persicicus]|nr:hypothetical protein [Roseibacillus persicicus]